MNILVKDGELQSTTADTIFVSIFQDSQELSDIAAEIDQALEGAIGDVMESGDFTGKLGDVIALYPRGAIEAKRVIVVGLGEIATFNLEAIREASAVAIKQAEKLGAAVIATAIQNTDAGGIHFIDAAQALVEGSLMALYKYDASNSESEKSESTPESLIIIEPDESRRKGVEQGARVGQIIAEGVHLARNLVNHPSNIATPSGIAEAAQSMCVEAGLICQILDETAIEHEKMGLLLAVNQGSSQPAKFITMEHKPTQSTKSQKSGPIVLIGKGVSFDTGGYSLKPQAGMLGMKGDMSGAAAVIGAMYAIGKLNLPLHVVGLVPSVENMVSSTAFKPNDVFVSKNGTRVEIINTDGEGRLVLADAMSYADSLNPSVVIDVATLTGAKKVALGSRINAVLTNNDDLHDALVVAGDRVSEPLWRLPIDTAYDAQLRSDVADIKNDGGMEAATITAARFLARFVGDWAWAHIDIAGSQYYSAGPEQNSRSYMTKGASGTPMRTLVEYVRSVS